MRAGMVRVCLVGGPGDGDVAEVLSATTRLVYQDSPDWDAYPIVERGARPFTGAMLAYVRLDDGRFVYAGNNG